MNVRLLGGKQPEELPVNPTNRHKPVTADLQSVRVMLPHSEFRSALGIYQSDLPLYNFSKSVCIPHITYKTPVLALIP